VPEAYRTLYRELESDLSLLEPGFKALSSRKTGETAFGVDLPATTAQLIGATPDGDQLTSAALALDRLQALGVRIVCLNVLYPVLTHEFIETPLYSDVYRRIATEIRRRGLLLVVAMGVREPEEAGTPLASASGLNRTRFNSGLREMAEAILTDLQPDYLTVLSEPDTVAQHTGLTFPPEEFAATVQQVVQGLDPGATKLGAGAGTWTALNYIKELGAIAELYYLDLHIHPVRYGFASDRVTQAAEVARGRGKKIAIGAAWLQKVSSREFGRLSRPEALAREVFSFWQPLDRRFVEMVVEIAHSLEVEFCTFSRTQYLFAALAYGEVGNRPAPAQLLKQVDAEATAGMAAGQPTPTGERLGELIGSQAPEFLLDRGTQTP
jgi:hypothetical protein